MNDRKSAARFLALVERYENFDTLTTVMLNEFIEKIAVHERDRKGSTDTTQKIGIYFNLIGQFIPPSMQEKEPAPEELEEIRKKEARKDRLHRNYLRRKANGQQKAYEERTKAQRKAEVDAMKEAGRAKDRENGVYYIVSDAGVPEIPGGGRKKGSRLNTWKGAAYEAGADRQDCRLLRRHRGI